MNTLILNMKKDGLTFCQRKAAVLLKFIFAGFILFSQFAVEPVQALGNEKMSETRIKLSFNNQEAVIRMTDNPATRQFLAMLPAEFRFSDFHGQEKITDFPKPVDLSNAPRGMIGEKGKLFIYAPWGNMGIFYKDFSRRPDNNLIELGNVESGLANLGSQKSDFTAQIEIVE